MSSIVRRRSRRMIAAVTTTIVVAIASIALPASAEVSNATPALQIVGVDARGEGISVDYLSTKDAASEVSIEVDGDTSQVAPKPLSDFGIRPSVNVVIDNSAGISNATMRVAMEDLAALAPTPDGIAKMGVVTAGNGARLVGKPTDSFAAATANFDGVKVGGTSSLWDATSIAAGLDGANSALRSHLVLVVGSADSSSAKSFSTLVRELRDANVLVHVVVVSGSGADVGALQELVNLSGGTIQSGNDDDFATMFSNIAASIASERRVILDSIPPAGGEFGTVRLVVGEDKAVGGFRPGVYSHGADAVAATLVQAEPEGSFFTSDIVKYFIIVVGAGAAAGFVFAVGLLVSKRRDGLNHALRFYDESYEVPRFGEAEDANTHATAAILQRAVSVTETIAKDRGINQRVEGLLERADLPLRPAEALTFYFAGAGAAVLLALFLTRSFMITLVVVMIAGILPGFAVDFMAKRRKKKFNRMLPDMLSLLAGTLRAGYSIGQGIEAVSNEVDDPMGKELRRAVTEARLGRPLDEALEGIAHRLESDDFEWAVMAIRIQREVGGNLAELLMTVSDTMVQRERLRRDVASLTAEGRMSAIILGMLPPGLAVVMYMMNPEYISKLFSGTGLYLLGGAIVMMIIGFVWMKKTITIEV